MKAHSCKLFISRFPILFVLLFGDAATALDRPASNQASEIDASFENITLDISEPQLSTNVAALTIQGPRRWDRLSIPDLDIIIDENGNRLIPLLRMLGLIRARGAINGNMVVFSVQPRVQMSLDLERHLLQTNDGQSTLAVVSGVSDITGRGEVFVSESVLKLGLGFAYQWDDLKYAYIVETQKTLPVFSAMERDRKRALVDIKNIAAHLPETEPTHYPYNYRQAVNFIDAGIRIDNRTGSEYSQSTLRPDIDIYGQLRGGNYFLRLSDNINYPDPKSANPAAWVDKALWVSNSDNFSIRAGDTSQGLSNLVAPSASFTGVVSRGIFGGDKAYKRHFLDSSRFSFLSETQLNGFAALGSKVELYVNNRLVDSLVAEDTRNAPPGQARYEFVGVGLFGRASNEVRIVVTQPNGTVDNIDKTVVGTTNLLLPGQFAYSAGAGTRRRNVDGKMETDGLFGGLGLYYGINRYITAGLTTAVQDHFFYDFDEQNTKLPKRYYLGETVAVKPTERLLLNAGLARNFTPDSEASPNALDLSVQYWLDHALLSYYRFAYDNGYSNGTLDVANRVGQGIFSDVDLFGVIGVRGSFATIDNNQGDRHEDYLAAVVDSGFVLPNTQLSLRFDRFHLAEDNTGVRVADIRHMYSASSMSYISPQLTLKVDYAWGDPIGVPDADDLRYSVGVPLIGTVLAFGTNVAARYQFSYNTAFQLAYRDSMLGTKNVEIAASRALHKKYRPDIVAGTRYDLTRQANYVNIDMEIPIDPRRRSVFGGGIGYNELSNEYFFRAYLSFRELFYADRGHISRLRTDAHISPENGGIKGLVYLDTNANGHLDNGEPGLPNIDVYEDGRKKYITDKNGYFFIGRNESKQEVTVSFNEKELSALYTPTQGRQKAEWEEYTFTRVNLGLSVLSAISGRVAVRKNEQFVRNLPGVIVVLKQKSDGSVVKQSITDEQGVYYLGELKPQEYRIEIDPSSIPPMYRAADKPPEVKLAASTEFQELDGIDISVVPREQ